MIDKIPQLLCATPSYIVGGGGGLLWLAYTIIDPIAVGNYCSPMSYPYPTDVLFNHICLLVYLIA